MWEGRGTAAAAMGRIVIALVLLAATHAHAPTFTLDVKPRGVSAWQADALAAALTADLGDHEFRVAKPPAPADVTVHVELAPGKLRYELTSQRAPIVGVIELAG